MLTTSCQMKPSPSLAASGPRLVASLMLIVSTWPSLKSVIVLCRCGLRSTAQRRVSEDVLVSS
eukprot:scaffold37642_cov62-Phaeocystis_antarctica.AAC.1